MKRILSYTLIFLVITSIGLLNACEDDFIDEGRTSIPSDKSIVAQAEGGTVVLKNGNIILEFPEGAILKKTAIYATACDLSNCSDFIIHPIEIRPNLSFQKPVLLKIRYDCELANENLTKGLFAPCGCFWKNEQQLLFGLDFKPMNCELDPWNKTLSMYLTETGVIAVKCPNP